MTSSCRRAFDPFQCHPDNCHSILHPLTSAMSRYVLQPYAPSPRFPAIFSVSRKRLIAQTVANWSQRGHDKPRMAINGMFTPNLPQQLPPDTSVPLCHETPRRILTQAHPFELHIDRTNSCLAPNLH